MFYEFGEEQMKINVNSFKSAYLIIYFDEMELARATGFFVRKGDDFYLITNRHVVTGRNNETGECLDAYAAVPNKLRIYFPYYKNEGYSWGELDKNLYDDNDNSLWIEHPIYEGKVDVVALYLGKHDQFEFCYDMETQHRPIVSDNVFILGFPFGFNVRPKNGKFAIWSTGTIASDPDLDININGEQLPAFLVDSRTRPGQSGSPVIYYNSNGMDRYDGGIAMYAEPVMHEIGIYSGRINKDSDLGYVWKWSLIKDIIDKDSQ